MNFNIFTSYQSLLKQGNFKNKPKSKNGTLQVQNPQDKKCVRLSEGMKMCPSPFTILLLPQPHPMACRRRESPSTLGKSLELGTESSQSDCFPLHSPLPQSELQVVWLPSTASCLPFHMPTATPTHQGRVIFQPAISTPNAKKLIAFDFSSTHLINRSLKHNENTQRHKLLLKTVPYRSSLFGYKGMKRKLLALWVPHSTVITWTSVEKEKRKSPSV